MLFTLRFDRASRCVTNGWESQRCTVYDKHTWWWLRTKGIGNKSSDRENISITYLQTSKHEQMREQRQLCQPTQFSFFYLISTNYFVFCFSRNFWHVLWTFGGHICTTTLCQFSRERYFTTNMCRFCLNFLKTIFKLKKQLTADVLDERFCNAPIHFFAFSNFPLNDVTLKPLTRTITNFIWVEQTQFHFF